MANFNQGSQVEHMKFGLGTVLSHSEERIIIKFDDHGEKKFVSALVMAALKKSDRQPPPEKRASRARKAKAAAPAVGVEVGVEMGIEVDAAVAAIAS